MREDDLGEEYDRFIIRRQWAARTLVMTEQQTGWIQNDEAVQQYIAARAMLGQPAIITAARPDLKGFWKQLVERGVYSVLLFQSEEQLLGHYLPADFQKRGTCFPSGSMVWMADGTEKAIQDIRVGDEVLSHTGIARKVLDVGCRSYSGDLVSISLKGWPHSVSMTAEHPVAHYPRRPRMKALRADATNRKRRKLAFLPLTWTAAGDLQIDDRVLCPRPMLNSTQQHIDILDCIPKEKLVRVFKQPIAVADNGVRCKNTTTVVPRHVACDERFCRVLGLYAAEGCVDYRATKAGEKLPAKVVWTLCSDEQHFADEICETIRTTFGVECAVRSEAAHNVIRVVCSSKAVASVFAKVCPGNALTKRVPEIVFRSPESHRLAFLRAWMDGDGHFRQDRDDGKTSTVTRTTAVGVTSSAGLAADICRLASGCGFHVGWTPRKRSAHQRVRAETVNFYGDEATRLYHEREVLQRETFGTNPPKQWITTEHGWARKVTSTSRMPVYNLAVYNLEVEEDHSYIVAGLAVHNCVGRGTYRAVQTGYWDAVAERRITGKAEQIAYEPIYAGGRVNIGRGAVGSGDGCVGAWAAQWCHDYGVLERGVHGAVDLSRDREDLAVSWGAPGRGVPREIAEASQAHKCDAYHVGDANDLADVTAARYASAICSTHQQSDRRDQNGECGYKGPTAHCEAIVGVYMRPTWNGSPSTIYENTGFVDQQSWGQIPGGPDILRMYKDEAKLREGAYGQPMQAMRKRIVTGETWSFQLRDGFVKSSKLSEVVK